MRQLVEVVVRLVVGDVDAGRVRHEDVRARVNRSDGRRKTSDSGSRAKNINFKIPSIATHF